MTGARRGFTLWEIGLVLALIGIMMGVAIPAFVRLGADDPSRAVDVVLKLLRDTRRLAIDQGVTVATTLDPATARYRVDTIGNGGVTASIADTVLPLPLGASLTADSLRVQFFFLPTGAAIADSVAVRGDGTTMMVSVDPWTGVARADAR